MAMKLDRLIRLPIDFVLPMVDMEADSMMGNFRSVKIEVDLTTVALKASSCRMQTHKAGNCQCNQCGQKASYFAVERRVTTPPTLNYHLNLYGEGDTLFHSSLLPGLDPADMSSRALKNFTNYRVLCATCFKAHQKVVFSKKGNHHE